MQRSLFLRIITAWLLALSAGAFVAQAQNDATQPVVYLPAISNEQTQVVGDSLQEALSAARPGDVLLLQAATYEGDLTIRTSGRPDAPIVLRGRGIGQTIIRGKVRFAEGVAFWRIEDLDIDASGEDDGIRIEPEGHDITLRGLHLYGGSGYGVRIGNDAYNVTIEDSEIAYFDAGSSDAHGVGIMTAHTITIRRCNIHHNSGDAIQSNTPDYPGYERYASNILIEDNDLHENRENAIDIKSTRGVIVRNNRMWGFRAVDSSDGMAVQVQYDARDVLITGNRIWDAVQGVEVTRGKKNGELYPAAPQNVTIAGNLITDLDADQGGDSARGSGVVVRTSSNVRVYNNTILRADRAALYISRSVENQPPQQVDVRNNVLEGGENDIYFGVDLAGISGLIVDYNHYVRGQIDGESLNDWLGLGYEGSPSSGDPLLDDAVLPRLGSPLLDSGTDVGFPYRGEAPDRGWGEFAP